MALWKYGRFLGESQLSFTRTPFETTNRWENLHLPADYSNNKLVPFHAQKADSSSPPWLADVAAYGHNDGSIGITQKLAGSNFSFHFLNEYSPTEAVVLPSTQTYVSLSGWTADDNEFSYEFFLDNDQVEVSPAVLADDAQTGYWTLQLGGSGSYTWVADNDASVKYTGADSYRVLRSAGGNSYFSFYHTYGPYEDWSSYEFFTAWLYGDNDGAPYNFYIACPDYANRYQFDFTDNWTGWKRFVFPFVSNAQGSPDLTQVQTINFGNLSKAGFHLDRVLIDVGTWVYSEIVVPDDLKVGSQNAFFYSWNGAAYNTFFMKADCTPEQTGGAQRDYDGAKLQFLDGSDSNDYGTADQNIELYQTNTRGQTGAAILTSPATDPITYSANYGCRNRLGFAIKMPPDDGNDSSTAGISQCRLKVTIKYDDTDATYEFANDTDNYWGLKNLNDNYLVLFKDDSGGGTVDFLDIQEINPTEIYDDDETFWTLEGLGSGSYAYTGVEETTVVKKGSSSYKLASSAGSFSWCRFRHWYGSGQDWSAITHIGIWMLGANTTREFRMDISSDAGDNTWSNSKYFTIADDFVGWRRIVLPIEGFTTLGGSLNWAAVRGIAIRSQENANWNGTVYFDRLVLDYHIDSLSFTANRANEISQVTVGISNVNNDAEVYWGQSDENPATESALATPDVIVNIRALVNGGGYS